VPLLGRLIRLAVLRGDLAGAQAHLDRMHELGRTGITAAPEDVVWPEGLLLHATGAGDLAFPVLSAFYASLPERPALIIDDPAAAATLARIALGAGDRERARQVAYAAQKLARRNPGSHSAAGAAAHAGGLVHKDPVRLRRAVEEFRRTPRLLALASVAEGLTNLQVAERLFVSRHTVDSHLRHIFTKLGIRRRVELAALVARKRAGS
jgi:ATP/maltotriose-dependent transcriptional regulator MalT